MNTALLKVIAVSSNNDKYLGNILISLIPNYLWLLSSLKQTSNIHLSMYKALFYLNLQNRRVATLFLVRKKNRRSTLYFKNTCIHFLFLIHTLPHSLLLDNSLSLLNIRFVSKRMQQN